MNLEQSIKRGFVFSQDECQNHGLNLRAAFEGRILWELLNISRYDTKTAEEIFNQYEAPYNSLYGNYPVEQDPGRLFERVTVPVLAPIKAARTITTGRSNSSEGDEFEPIYHPITMHPHKGVKNDRHSFQVLNADSFNLFSKSAFLISEYEYACDYVPELKLFGSKTEISHRFYSNIQAIYRDKHDKITITNLTSIPEATFLQELSRMYVLYSLFKSRQTKDNHPKVLSYAFCNYGTDFPRVVASSELRIKIGKKGEELCEEYLSQMKYTKWVK